MRFAAFLLLGILVSPLLAESPQDAALEAALNFVPAVLEGTPTKGLLPRDFAIAEEPVSCDEVFLKEWLGEWHSQPVVDELVAAYVKNGAQRSRIHSDASVVPTIALDRFRTSDNQYDWEALRSAHPEVRGVVRMSMPALESQAVYAVAHYEVVTAEGRAFANFQRFEKRGDGTWKPTSGVTGLLRGTAHGEGKTSEHAKTLQ